MRRRIRELLCMTAVRCNVLGDSAFRLRQCIHVACKRGILSTAAALGVSSRLLQGTGKVHQCPHVKLSTWERPTTRSAKSGSSMFSYAGIRRASKTASSENTWNARMRM